MQVAAQKRFLTKVLGEGPVPRQTEQEVVEMPLGSPHEQIESFDMPIESLFDQLLICLFLCQLLLLLKTQVPGKKSK
jgi:hypothetical protein